MTASLQNERAPAERATELRGLPGDLRAFRDYHAGETVLVCGCGTSLAQVVAPERFITIGVNDVGRLFHPDYLVVLNPKNQFQGDRFRFVEESRARAVFTQLDLGIRHPHVVRIRLGKYGGVDFADSGSLHFTRNSPYLALCLAIHMGARRIGLIGVDFTDDHFFARTGRHQLIRELPKIDQEYAQLYAAGLARNVEIFNLSASSRLTAIPKLPFDEFTGLEIQKEALRVVSYATTPVAGVPAILSRCIAARTPNTARTVWSTNSYGNGVVFDGDVEWQSAQAEAISLLRSADVVIAHNGKIDPKHCAETKGKPILTMAHNYIWNVETKFVDEGYPGVVVGQYQATLPEFKGWQPVPNPVPLWEADYRNGPKNDRITICFTPSGKHESYPENHKLYWHSKGYETTTRVLRDLARRYPIQLEITERHQVSHRDSLAMKRRAHIVIDECVTGSYHRNSLEGLACGCVVVNGVGKLPAISEMFLHCAGGATEMPFVYADLQQLEAVLTRLIESGHESLLERGRQNRQWMETHWDFGRQWTRFWIPAVNAARERTTKVVAKSGVPTRAMGFAKSAQQGVSVVVCHGGEERLPHLAASLANLRQCRGVDEVIVADMGRRPSAEDTARRWADKYIFLHNDDVFERARCLNAGTLAAEFDLVLWKDNDLIVPVDFVRHATEELRAQKLDYLIPYTAVNYLSEADSLRVMEGTVDPSVCKHVQVYVALRHVCGAAGLVRKDFVLSSGGLPEEFRGWGGEDDAWWHKANLLGRTSATRGPHQQMYHLFHINSGAYGGSRHRDSNPYYSNNVAVLNKMRSLRNSRTFLKRFPPKPLMVQSWNNRTIVFSQCSLTIAEAATEEIARQLIELTGAQIIRLYEQHGRSQWSLPPEVFPDAIVVFDLPLALSLLANKAVEALWPKTVVVYANGHLTDSAAQLLRRAGAIAADDSSMNTLRNAGLRPWCIKAADANSAAPFSTALGVLQPLSIIMGGTVMPNASERTVSGIEEAKAPSTASRVDLPVWMYWEGACPKWIQECRKTVFAHAGDVRVLSAEDFDKLRDVDRDISLKHLHVAQRADYIRAFLLARYGGLWVDSDCVVMQSLQTVLDALAHYDFIAHRERKAGVLANDFMAARAGSGNAAELYRNICKTLRSQRHIGWTQLGCLAVTEVLQGSRLPWLEIELERIQPICWSEPAAYFTVATAEDHERSFDKDAICYMLSNLTMQERGNRLEDLTAEGTFFNYLINTSLNSKSGGAPPALDVQPMTKVFARMIADCSKAGLESISGPGSSLLQTAEIRRRLPQLIRNLGALSLLDAPCGDFNWMKQVAPGIREYIGADVIPFIAAENQRKFGSAGIRFVNLDITRQPGPKVDLILCRDCLVHLPDEDILRALKNFKDSQSRYLLTTTFPTRAKNRNIALGDWQPLNLQAPPFNFPEPMELINEGCSENNGIYRDKSLGLWRLEDVL